MDELLPGVWRWSVHNAERGIDFNGWFVRRDGATVVVDPPPANAEVLREVERHGAPEAVLLTNKDHARDCVTFRDHFGCPIWIHELDAPLVDLGVLEVYRDGATLPTGLVASTLADSKTPGETAFWVPGESAAWIVGDAVLGRPAGELSMLPDAKFDDPAAAKRGLNKLLERDFDALLLGDGEPILTGAMAQLRAWLLASSL